MSIATSAVVALSIVGSDFGDEYLDELTLSDKRLKVLIFAEAVTLAHVARPIALAAALDARLYDVTIACDPRYASFASGGHWSRVDLRSIPSEQFLKALERGSPVYNFETLAEYADNDARLIETVRPDVVVGDFRLSLSVSARLAKVPYLAIANAYWSPHYQQPFPMPVLPLSRALPLPLASALFSAFRPLAFAAHCAPMNKLRAKNGLPAIGSDLRRVYTDSDHLLVPDVEQMYPLSSTAKNFTYLGPLIWSPQISLPSWWNDPVPQDQPIVYLSMGSSGSRRVVEAVLDAVKQLPIAIIVSTAGPVGQMRLPPNVRHAPYLPGDAATARSRLVICNGGSLTTQQAIATGVPVLGIASNMDQFFNMDPIHRSGAGRLLRSDRLTADAIRNACLDLVQSKSALVAAQQLKLLMAPSVSVGSRFDAAVARLVGS